MKIKKVKHSSAHLNWSLPLELVDTVLAHQTLGRGVHGSIPVQGVVCCGLEQVALPQLDVYQNQIRIVYW